MGKTIYNRMDPDFYDEEPIDYDELSDLKALHDEEESMERRIEDGKIIRKYVH